jgi:hypothetical protein
MHVRGQAARSLGVMGGRKAVAALQRALKDPASLTFVRGGGVGPIWSGPGPEMTVFPVREDARDALRPLGMKGDVQARALSLVADAQNYLQVFAWRGPDTRPETISQAEAGLVYLRQELLKVSAPAVLALLDTPVESVYREAWPWQRETIRLMGNSAIAELQKAVRTSRGIARERALQSLADIRGERPARRNG